MRGVRCASSRRFETEQRQSEVIRTNETFCGTFPLDVEIPVGAVAIGVVSNRQLELDELMILPAIASAAYPVHDGGELILRAASADSTAETLPGETGSAYGVDGTWLGPVNRGRRELCFGAFAVTRRGCDGCRQARRRWRAASGDDFAWRGGGDRAGRWRAQPRKVSFVIVFVSFHACLTSARPVPCTQGRSSRSTKGR